jgi:uncharacterized protein
LKGNVASRILVDIGHPAHVHLFRNAIKIWQSHDHEVAITTRDKDVTVDLLKSYGFTYDIVSKARKGVLGLAYELVEHDFGVLKAAIRHRSQILIGTSVAITHVAPLIGAKSVVFNEDDASVAKAFVRLAYPFAHSIVTPTTLNENHGKKHITYEGYQKLAYLHPNYFSPDPAIKKKLGIRHDERYFLMRFVSQQAAHDHGEFGMGADFRLRIIETLQRHGKVFITSEVPLTQELECFSLPVAPSEIHHVLAFADIFIGDSQSMTVEAAILGVPSLRINSFADRCSILVELQNKYQLTYGYFPSQEDEIFYILSEWLKDAHLKEKWQEKRKILLEDKIDVTHWMVGFIESLM